MKHCGITQLHCSIFTHLYWRGLVLLAYHALRRSRSIVLGKSIKPRERLECSLSRYPTSFISSAAKRTHNINIHRGTYSSWIYPSTPLNPFKILVSTTVYNNWIPLRSSALRLKTKSHKPGNWNINTNTFTNVLDKQSIGCHKVRERALSKLQFDKKTVQLLPQCLESFYYSPPPGQRRT